MRPLAPLLMETADLGQAKRRATNAISSSLALPSTGSDFSCASQMPSSPGPSSVLIRALGLTLIRMVCKLLLPQADMFLAPEISAFLP
jgi:hypothetical protein